MSTRIDGEVATGSEGGEPPFPSVLDGAANVLLLGSAMDDRSDEGCIELLDVAPAAKSNVICVTYAGSPHDRLRAWSAYRNHDTPANTGFVDVGRTDRTPSNHESVHPIETVPDPADLTGLGIKLNAFCKPWADDDSGLAVCFHSLSTLLRYVGVQRAFRFLHHVTDHLRSTGAVAHYHLDPAVHDEQTVNSIQTLFDAVVEPDAEDGWRITTR